MAGFVDSVEQAILNHLLTDPAYTPPATMYIGLSTTTPTDVYQASTQAVSPRLPTVAIRTSHSR